MRQQAEFAHHSWPADPSYLGAIRSAARRWLAPLRLSEEVRQDLVLAINEAATNAVEHAYRPAVPGTVDITFWTEPGALCVEITDQGRWRPPANGTTGNGLGLSMMNRLVDSVLIHFDPRGTRVLLRHPVPPMAMAGSAYQDAADDSAG